MRAALTTVLVLGITLLVGCSPEPLCERDSSMRGVVGNANKENLQVIVRDKLTVTGRLASEVYIRSVRVNGELASSTSGNFEGWSAVLPAQALQVAASGDRATVTATATDICGTEYLIDSFEVPVELSNAVVTNLTLAADVDEQRCYVPVGGRHPLRVVASADASSAGAEVQFSSVPQASFSAPRARLKPGELGAEIDTFFTAEVPGRHLVSVVGAGAREGPLGILVVGPPTFSPNALSLDRGQAARLLVRSAGNIANCTAYSTHGGVAWARIDAADLLAGAVPVSSGAGDCEQEEIGAVDVGFESRAPPGAKLTLRCRDIYGQEAEAVITATAERTERRTGALSLGVAYPDGNCFVPMEPRGAATVTAIAPSDAAGISVVFESQQGSFPGTVAGAAELRSAGVVAGTRVSFRPNSRGVANIAARAPGAFSVPVSVLVVGPPTMAPADTSVARGGSAEVAVSSAGDLSMCFATASHPAATEVQLASGDDLLLGPVSVAQSPKVCIAPEVVRIRVTFAVGAPTGASVRIECLDPYGQSGVATMTATAEEQPRLTRLDLVVTPPAAGCYVPIDRADYATVEVVANAGADGASVKLHAPVGEFPGGDTVTLSGNTTDAVGSAFLSSGAVSPSIPVLASAGGVLAGPVFIRAAGRPMFSPTTLALSGGTVGRVEASTLGTLESCSASATHPAETTVTMLHGSNPDLTAGSAVVSLTPADCTDVERLSFDVSFSAGAPSGAAVEVRCRDVFGQENSITVTRS